MTYDDIKKTIVSVMDFPKKGIDFKDITPLFLQPKMIDFIIDEMATFAKTIDFDIIVAPESRGFLFGLPLSLKTKKPFVLVRKKNKLPREVESIDYELEYGTSTLQVIKEDIKPNMKVLIVDDLIATGGTSIAIQNLMKKLGAEVVGQVYLIELVELCKHENLMGKFFSMLKY